MTEQGTEEEPLPKVVESVMAFHKEWQTLCLQSASEPDMPLHHYTDANGLLGILQTRQLWATNPVFMNDQTELLHSLFLLKEIVSDPSGTGGRAGEPSTQADEVVMVVIEQFYRFLEIYVVCFCTSGDLLSQWRGYGKSGGYAIGFDPKGLLSIATGPVVLRPVVYDQAVQRSMLCDLIRRWRGSFIGAPSRNTDVRPWNIGALMLAMAFTEIAVAFKSDAFQEECEWRLIVRQLPMIPENPFGLRFRNRDGTIISYVELGVPQVDGERPPLPISNVMMGPRHYSNVDGYAVVKLLKSFGYIEGSVSVNHSQVPLRM